MSFFSKKKSYFFSGGGGGGGGGGRGEKEGCGRYPLKVIINIAIGKGVSGELCSESNHKQIHYQATQSAHQGTI